MSKHDVIVIGGSLAGAACVRELVRRDIDAIAFERDHFPRKKVCGGFLSPGAVDCIERLGLIDHIREAGAVQVTSARVRAAERETTISFRRPGLGISRGRLDEIVARSARVEEGHMVAEVRRTSNGFVVDGAPCSVVIDASGKLGRFTKRRAVEEFGIQYEEPIDCGAVLDFSFFEDGYGGSVSIEGGRSNSCFLIKKDALPKYVRERSCVVTGPLAYDRMPGEFMAIGDAAGMLDPFCGEGMRHALESGMLAADVVASGLCRRAAYGEMKADYESLWRRQWAVKRGLAATMRSLVRHPYLFSPALKITPAAVINRILWGTGTVH